MNKRILANKTTESKNSAPSATGRRAEMHTQPSFQGNLLQLHRTYGNRAVQKMYDSGVLQSKLMIGQPGDSFEQEADSVAERVMKMPDPDISRQEDEDELQSKPLVDKITPLVQREVEDEEEVQRQSEEEEESVQMMLQGQPEKKEVQQQPEEEKPVQAKGGSETSPAVTSSVESGINSLRGGGQSLSESTRAFFEPRFGADFSGVRVHANTRAGDLSKSISAKAFTLGNDVVFGFSQYSPESSSGKQLLAHELTHVVQQGSRSVRRNVIQRRVPSSSDISSLIKEKKGATPAEVADRLEYIKGLRKIISRELLIIEKIYFSKKAAKVKLANDTLWKQHPELKGRELKSGKADAALRKEWIVYYGNPAKAAIGPLLKKSPDVDTALKSDKYDILEDLLDAIIKKYPIAAQGDPKFLNVPPQTAAQKAKLKILLKNVDKLYGKVLGGTYDKDIKQVFGDTNLAQAKTKYTKAKSWLSANSGKIISDFSGFSKRAGLGGFARYLTVINLPEFIINNPNKSSSKITTFHEGMHAANIDVKDKGYYTSEGFDALPENAKLENAAHFEEVPRRILGVSKYAGKRFTPIGTPLSSGKIRKQTNYEYAKRKASEIFRKAWTACLRVYFRLSDVYKKSSIYTQTTISGWGGLSPKKVFPYWSSVKDLTIHKRKGPAKTPPIQPVTRIDLALSEGVAEKIKYTMREVKKVSAEKDADVPASKSDLKKDSNKDKLADFNVEKTLSAVGTITKDIARDKKVIKEMSNNADRIVEDRPPVGW